VPGMTIRSNGSPSGEADVHIRGIGSMGGSSTAPLYIVDGMPYSGSLNNLNTNVENLKTESHQKTQTINTQDKELHTAWYVFGTKNELREQNILVKGDVLKSNFNKNYFTKIDIRVDKEIKLYSKSAKLLTAHPSASYSLIQDASGQYILRINNPQQFWSTSKYLVVLVK
ncbi:MAG: TonB-dependent receptor plug domain-containing protein, partial [Prevotella sp.]|nr:TonB-dependent receptor plug domain-containing protein [Prevotella sp.]